MVPLLKDYKIALTGYFDHGSHQLINDLIQQQGGETFSKKEILYINLLVVGNQTQTETDLMIAASVCGKPIVNENWLFVTINQQKIADLIQYSWNTTYQASMCLHKNYFWPIF